MESPTPYFPADTELADIEILGWVKRGDAASIARAVQALVTNRRLVATIRKRVRQQLETRQMLFPDQVFYRLEAEEDALAWIFDRVLCAVSLPKTLLERGGGFDPSRGSLFRWLLVAADYQLRDWLKKHGGDVQEAKTGEDANHVALAEAPTELRDDGEWTERLRDVQVRLRDAFRDLSDMPRACLTVKHLDPAILGEEDLACLWRIRRRNAFAAAAVPTFQDLADVRFALSQLRTGVLARARAKQVRFRELADRVTLLHAKCQQLEPRVAWARRQLEQAGWRAATLDEIAAQAVTVTLEVIRRRATGDLRTFMEGTQRLAKTHKRREEAREQFRRAESDFADAATPVEIAEFLGSTVSAVSPALTRAMQALQSVLADPPDSDARTAANNP